jgi:hypothetical protein
MLLRWSRNADWLLVNRAQGFRQLALPLLLNVGWGAFALFGAPAIIRLPFGFGLYIAPDLFSLLLISGIVAIVWAIVRTAFIWRIDRRNPVAGTVGVLAPE